MRCTWLMLILIFPLCSFAQRIEPYPENEPGPKIDLIIHIYDDDPDKPVVNAKVMLVGSEGLSLTGYTDSSGMLAYPYSDYMPCITAGNIYTLEVEGVYGKHLGTEDAFSTENITLNTRLIRELRIIPSCRIGWRFPFLNFENSSAALSNYSLDSLNYLHDLMIEHPNMILEICSVFDNDAEQKLAQKRANAVAAQMLQLGIPSERFVFRLIKRSEENIDDAVDIQFRILSFDYMPTK